MDDHDHSHLHHHGATENIALAFFLNLGFCIIELIGGILTNSIAILSDALHDFGDSIALGLAWVFQKKSQQQPNVRYTYGYKRFSLLSAIINSIILVAGSAFVIYESVKRVLEPAETNAHGMLLLAILGVIINGIAILRLRKGSSVNERVVSLHLLEDVLGWIAVLIGSIVMIFADLPILDPILSLAIACFILFNVYRNLKTVFQVILQAKPDNVDTRKVEEALMGIPGVESIHDLHIWTMDSEYNVATVHLVLKQTLSLEDQQRIRAEAHHLLIDLGIEHATVEIEYSGEDCSWCEPSI
ncbi:cation diffusion facilitator family transporter [Bacteroidales bacterium OttesenSCG-928-L03]|nr:cation diffusion facilitator family transporter [Bacteroidales bacterium OttesenSCG-928-L03]